MPLDTVPVRVLALTLAAQEGKRGGDREGVTTTKQVKTRRLMHCMAYDELEFVCRGCKTDAGRRPAARRFVRSLA